MRSLNIMHLNAFWRHVKSRRNRRLLTTCRHCWWTSRCACARRWSCSTCWFACIMRLNLSGCCCCYCCRETPRPSTVGSVSLKVIHSSAVHEVRRVITREPLKFDLDRFSRFPLSPFICHNYFGCWLCSWHCDHRRLHDVVQSLRCDMSYPDDFRRNGSSVTDRGIPHLASLSAFTNRAAVVHGCRH